MHPPYNGNIGVFWLSIWWFVTFPSLCRLAAEGIDTTGGKVAVSRKAEETGNMPVTFSGSLSFKPRRRPRSLSIARTRRNEVAMDVSAKSPFGLNDKIALRRSGQIWFQDHWVKEPRESLCRLKWRGQTPSDGTLIQADLWDRKKKSMRGRRNSLTGSKSTTLLH